MYYQNYEDYMRQVLGYPPSAPNSYETYGYRTNRASENTYYSNKLSTNLTENEILDLYPDSYNKIYPIVCKVCETNTEPITKESVERLTNEAYNLVESDKTVIKERVETPKSENRESSNITKSKSEITTDTSISKRTPAKSENREILTQTQQTRQSNSLLRDLIKILILQKLSESIHISSCSKQSRSPFQVEPGRLPFFENKPPIEQRTNMKYFNY